MTIQQSIQKNGARKTAIKMVDVVLQRKIGLSSLDLADSVTFMNGLDSIQDSLEAGDIQNAKDLSIETADEMLEEEGFGEFF
jgi:CRISPR/Cas system type I-B associated protein Csh2 (Cas7 group RAMP superfamily)